MVDSDVSDDASRTDKAPPTAGQILKSAREAKEISADRLARALNLDVPAVRAIESDRYAVIGAPVFVRGHLRKYAQLVDISADEVMAAYERAEEPADRVQLHPMKPEERPRSEGRLWPFVVLLLFVVGVVVWWLLRPTPPATLEAPDAAVPAEPVAAGDDAEGQPGSEAGAQPAPSSDGALVLPQRSSSAAVELPAPEPVTPETASGAGSSGPAASEPAAGSASPEEASAATVSEPPPVVAPRPESGRQTDEGVQRSRPAASVPAASSRPVPSPAVSAPTVSRPSATTPTANSTTTSAPSVSAPAVSAPTIEQELFSSGGLDAETGLLAEFVFSADSWVDVRDASGTRLVYELGRKGTTRSLRAEAPLTVFLGYADGVEVRIEGQPWPVPDRVRRGNTARFTLEAP